MATFSSKSEKTASAKPETGATAEQDFFFPTEGVTVKAATTEEAEKKLAAIKKTAGETAGE